PERARVEEGDPSGCRSPLAEQAPELLPAEAARRDHADAGYRDSALHGTSLLPPNLGLRGPGRRHPGRSWPGLGAAGLSRLSSGRRPVVETGGHRIGGRAPGGRVVRLDVRLEILADLYEQRVGLRLFDRGAAAVGVEVLQVEVQPAVMEQL